MGDSLRINTLLRGGYWPVVRGQWAWGSASPSIWFDILEHQELKPVPGSRSPVR